MGKSHLSSYDLLLTLLPNKGPTALLSYCVPATNILPPVAVISAPFSLVPLGLYYYDRGLTQGVNIITYY